MRWLALLLLLVSAQVAVVSAQSAGPHGRSAALPSVRPRLMADLQLALVSGAPILSEERRVADALQQARLDRGRAFVAGGAALAASGAFVATVLGRRRFCHDVNRHTHMKTPIILGSAVAAVGVGLLVAGVRLLVRSPRALRGVRPLGGFRYPIAIGGAVLTFGAASLVQFVAASPEWVLCETS